MIDAYVLQNATIILNICLFGNSLNILDRDENQKIVSGTDEVVMVILFAVGFSFFLFFYLKRLNAKEKQKYENLITDLKSKYAQRFENIINEANAVATYEDWQKQKMFIIDDTINILLVKLSEFEKSQKYIDRKMSLSTLSSLLNTNTKYLVEVIKQHKKKKFKDYINGLRITYVMELLLNYPEYREYKMNDLAKCCGFSSRVVFAVVFKKEIGVSPSSFIKNLRNKEN